MSVRILGLDPGLRRTGWGVIEMEGNQLRHIAHGVAKSIDSHILSQRLAQLYGALKDVITKYHPHEAAVEETFVNHNPKSTLKLGEARGVVMLAPARLNVPVAEYAPNQIKKTITGTGHASKDQMVVMVRYLLPLSGDLVSDSADALAVAICHAHHKIVVR